MGANIITGYTGVRHITPAMDAAVYRSVFGEDSYILADGDRLAGSMPSVNEFTVLGGVVSMQGHQIQVTQETLSVDTCANGYARIDLVAMRYTHDNVSLVDASQLVVIKGVEVQSGNTPAVPAHNTGIIDDGASIVDFPLYQLNINGSSITTTELYEVVPNLREVQFIEVEISSFSSLPQTITDARIKEGHKCLHSLLSNPAAQTSDWTVNTSDGSLTLSGSISGSTSATLYLTVTN